jgi:deoxyribodipyrimidine photo-lyase
MGNHPIQQSRIKLLNDGEIRNGQYVLYWMQQTQRTEYNQALEYAIYQANRLGQGLLVAFGLMNNYPEANERHYTFMLEGLRETQVALARRGVKMVVQEGDPPQVALQLGKKASLIVCDRGYLRHQKAWREEVAKNARCTVVQVESDVIVPTEIVSQKAEYAARTIRPKIITQLDPYLVPLKPLALQNPSMGMRIGGMNLSDPAKILRALAVDRSVKAVSAFFKGGTEQAKRTFRGFLKNKLKKYGEHSNQPQTDDISHMSMYLHFGQVSPLYLALETKKAGLDSRGNIDAYLEELIVRRELAINFVEFTEDYDRFSCLPDWASKTLAAHKKDRRPQLYTREALEDAETHDRYWNAAMNEMKFTGFMHNYMRMYWGKKILQWSPSPEAGFKRALAMNNKFFLDGRDPNSFTGVAWLFGVHDRAWAERPIYGKIRYMSASGLERKCDIAAYVKKVERLVKKAEAQ